MMDELVINCKTAYEKLKKAVYNNMVLITGPPSVGKRTITEKLFKNNRKMLHAYVNCYSITTPTNFFSVICQDFLQRMNIRRNEMGKDRLPEAGKPVTGYEFVRYFKLYLKFAAKKGYDKLYVVLDHLEELQKTNLMNCFATLVTIRNLNIIIITYELPMDIVHYTTSVSRAAGIKVQERITPIVVPTWTKDDTIKWILGYQPREDADIYKMFVENTVKLSYKSWSKNPTHIFHDCQDNFENFLQYYRENVKHNPSRSIAEGFWKSYKSSGINTEKAMNVWNASTVGVKLTGNTAILVIAAYVAAFTRPADDRRNFVRYQKRSGQKSSKPEYISRLFTFERLYHIFRGLQRIAYGTESKDEICENGFVLGDVERLEKLNILIHHSGWSVHPEARYKLSACVRRDYVNRLAVNHELELNQLHGLSDY